MVLPVNFVDISRLGYSLKFDCRTKNASIVYEHLTSKNFENRINRSKSKFKIDECIPKFFQNTLKDFRCSGYDRGHLAPAANHSETFFLSNISPQNPNFNRGYWKKLEKHVRNYMHQSMFSQALFFYLLILLREKSGLNTK